MESVLAGMLGSDVTSMERMGGGRNSQVYRVICDNSSPYVAKFYHHHRSDPRDRLEAEFSGLRFLWENGVRCIPRPIVAEEEHRCAVYSYVDGEKISAQEVTPPDILFAVQFLGTLETLKNSPGSRTLPPASEACFSVQDIVNTIERRWNRLSALCHNGTCKGDLRAFLEHEFKPSFEKITGWCMSHLNRLHMSFISELAYEKRTLSPSDFGFHNALRRSDGGITFLDFEYFGWDDPAKMISDFLLHPGMELCENLKRRFAAAILDCFHEDRLLAKRVEIVYPLFGLKWCLILLNEFIPEHLERRGFASKDELQIDELQAQQLSKSRRMLLNTMREYDDFPYCA